MVVNDRQYGLEGDQNGIQIAFSTPKEVPRGEEALAIARRMPMAFAG